MVVVFFYVFLSEVGDEDLEKIVKERMLRVELFLNLRYCGILMCIWVLVLGIMMLWFYIGV